MAAAGPEGEFFATSLVTSVYDSSGTRVRGSGLVLGKWTGPGASLTDLAEIVLHEAPGGDLLRILWLEVAEFRAQSAQDGFDKWRDHREDPLLLKEIDSYVATAEETENLLQSGRS